MDAPTWTPRIEWQPEHGPSTYWVESQTTPGEGYLVDGRTGRCTCPAAQHHRRCWHSGAAIVAHAAVATLGDRYTRLPDYTTYQPGSRLATDREVQP